MRKKKVVPLAKRTLRSTMTHEVVDDMAPRQQVTLGDYVRHMVGSSPATTTVGNSSLFPDTGLISALVISSNSPVTSSVSSLLVPPGMSDIPASLGVPSPVSPAVLGVSSPKIPHPTASTVSLVFPSSIVPLVIPHVSTIPLNSTVQLATPTVPLTTSTVPLPTKKFADILRPSSKACSWIMLNLVQQVLL
ncbi:hypothetical protein vseg_007786 [Gypsophila vaccaria]